MIPYSIDSLLIGLLGPFAYCSFTNTVYALNILLFDALG
uniref:Uncharacterized protein n=1 Tax=Candidatus Kentrum sp. TC TaxID=2126339 RepID=A0A450ZZY0_9GAMM|nr:MAG: hypothetical protein BECKTC1821D_GA0114238_102318 [Candidatus Kentron sp. TC]VFK59335.1 MAG: hypothetical protein BECKTC1821F_GA0114240_10324 [Candidatus Kentron sp. TC]